MLSLALAATLATTPVDPAVIERATELRHWFHANPELSNEENDTAARIEKELRALGFDVTTGHARHGVIGILEGGKPGPVIAVRADMDALPVPERTGLPFASTVDGLSHACGHDIHMSVGLGVAMSLAAERENLAGTVMFIFQPAEEGTPPPKKGGAELMMIEGVFDDLQPEAIFGLHSFPDMNVGEIGFTPGPAFAATDHFLLTVKGKQSHGSRPHQSIDPIVMSAELVSALQTIRSRNMNPSDPGVLSVGIMNGGSRFNIIPEEVHMEGTVRTYDPKVQDMIIERIHALSKGITSAHGGDYDLVYAKNTPVVYNNRALSAWASRVLPGVGGVSSVEQIPPTMGGEDFGYFSNALPGFFFRLGVVDPGKGSGGLHTPTMRADDASIPVGIAAMTSLVKSYLANPPEVSHEVE
ncbi:MAG: amidohydrolase [Gammaproteobacteria bacterium]|nr:amidohydrolase [Gammaproteobacteria bacterium]